MENSGWIVRTKAAANKRASWSAVLLAGISLIVQSVNFVKGDLEPLLQLARDNKAALERIERRLEDHERRISELELWQQQRQQRSLNGVWQRPRAREAQ